MRALQIAATGMSAQQMRVEVISNNLANMSTTGYNARRAEFADLHYQQLTRPGAITANDGTVVPTGVQLGLGVRPSAVTVNLAQGSLSATGGDLDVAIDGHGYLEVTLPSGASAYTRDGGLKRSADIPDIFEFDIEGVASRNKSGDPYYLDNTGHPANRRLALARTSNLTVKGFGLDLEMNGEGNTGHYAPFNWSN